MRARVLLALAIVAVTLLSHAPHRRDRSEFLGGDYPALLAAGTVGSATDIYEVGDGSLLVGLWTWGSRSVWGVQEGDFLPARPYRAENVFVLLCAAAGLAVFVRRSLLPWTGSEHARAAGVATLALVAVHPLTPALITPLSGRDELLSGALTAWAAAIFLAARQDRRPLAAVAAAVVCIAAGFAGGVSLIAPLLVGGAELASAHRYRPRRDRIRTTAITTAVYGGCVLVGPLVRLAVTGAFALPSLAGGAARSGSPWINTLEKLGLTLLPVSEHGGGGIGAVGAGFVLLLAVHPALRAVRSAPRLWGGLSLAWIAAIVATTQASLFVRVHPGDVTHAAVLVVPAAAMAIGIAVSSTALSGVRRTALPVLAALGYGLLTFFNTIPWANAAREVTGLRRDLVAARAEHGDAALLVVDPPGVVRGVDCLGGSLPLLLDLPESGRDGARPRGLSREAFVAFAREPEFDALRSAGLYVLVSERALHPGVDDGPQLETAQSRATVRLAAPRESAGARTWSEARSPDLDLEALEVGAVRVRLPSGVTPDEDAGRLAWRSSHETFDGHELVGALLEGDAGAELLFDTSASVAWSLADRIRRVWLVGAVPAARVEAVGELPVFEEEARWDEAWTLGPLAREDAGVGAVEAVMLDLDRLEAKRFVGRLVEGRASFESLAEWLEGRASVAFTVERVRGGLAVARRRGRL